MVVFAVGPRRSLLGRAVLCKGKKSLVGVYNGLTKIKALRCTKLVATGLISVALGEVIIAYKVS